MAPQGRTSLNMTTLGEEHEPLLDTPDPPPEEPPPRTSRWKRASPIWRVILWP